MTQDQLARAAGTSQATVSAYERGRKQPSFETFTRLLEATGTTWPVAHPPARPRRPDAEQLERAGRTLLQVIELAEALPVRHEAQLRYPRLPTDGRA